MRAMSETLVGRRGDLMPSDAYIGLALYDLEGLYTVISTRDILQR